MLCYQKIWQKWTLETLENIFQNEGFRFFSNVQTFLGSTKEGISTLLQEFTQVVSVYLRMTCPQKFGIIQWKQAGTPTPDHSSIEECRDFWMDPHLIRPEHKLLH